MIEMDSYIKKGFGDLHVVSITITKALRVHAIRYHNSPVVLRLDHHQT